MLHFVRHKHLRVDAHLPATRSGVNPDDRIEEECRFVAHPGSRFALPLLDASDLKEKLHLDATVQAA